MNLEFGRATTADEIAAVQRLRYAVYVEEMDRYHDVAGGDEARFAEPEDEDGWIFYARAGGEVVAATRMTWGGAGFSARQIEQYQLKPFLDEIPPALMAVGERNSVLPEYRGTGALDAMVAYSQSFTAPYNLRVVFACCEPHLLSLYLKMGCDELDGQRFAIFDGFTDDEAQRCIARSTIIECSAGDRVLKRGGTARNIFVVLNGTLEVRDGDTIVSVLTAGDAFGEMAFLLERPRSFHVDAAGDATRVLSLSEGALRKMIAEDATVAAKLLLNLSKMLCVKLIRTSH